MAKVDATRTTERLHPAWVVAFAGGVAVFCGLGLARFAFGMMLPAMSAKLGLTYSQGGVWGFAGLLGYLLAVPFVPHILRRIGTRSTVGIFLVIMALSMLAMGATKSFTILCLLYGLAGVASGGVILPAMSVMSQWFAPSHRGFASGIVMGGPGFGIILSGYIVPRLTAVAGLEAWQVGWMVFAAISLAAAVLVVTLIRNHPQELNVAPYGRVPAHGTAAEAALSKPARFRLLAHLGLIFCIYGATYMLYVTFIVTTMVDAYGMTEAAAGGLWSWFGFLCIFSGMLFGWVSDRIGRRRGMAIAFGVLATAYMLVGFGDKMFGLYASILLFGLSAWSVPVIMAASAGDFFGPSAAASALAILTLLFSVGQAAGPIIAGFLAEQSGSFSSSYIGAGFSALSALALSLALRPPHS